MDAAGRMRIARRKAGLSQAKLAAVLGVQRSAVGHWESVDGKNPTMAHLRAVAVATQVQFEWLATGRGEMQLTREQREDSVSAASGLFIDDALEMRLVQACRGIPARARVSLLEVAEAMATGRKPAKRNLPPTG